MQELHEIVQSLARKGTYIPIIDKDEANLTQVSIQAEQRKRSFLELTPLLQKTVRTFPPLSQLHNQKETLRSSHNWSGLVKSVLDDAATQILAQKEDVSRLAEIANKHPFYKYNGVWSRELQNLVPLPSLNPCHILLIIDWKGILHRTLRLARRVNRIQKLHIQNVVLDNRRSGQLPQRFVSSLPLSC